MGSPTNHSRDSGTQPLSKPRSTIESEQTQVWKASDVAAGETGAALPVIPGFSMIRAIVSGGMGSVFQAFDTRLQRPVAVKTMLPGMSKPRFLYESMIAARFPHPSIPPVYASGELDDGTPYFVMKLIDGETLQEILNRRSHPGNDVPRFLSIFQQVAQAVGYVHSKRTIHRDLKPANIMVGSFGEVQVMDWGLSKELDAHSPLSIPGSLAQASSLPAWSDGDSSLTQSGAVMGTPSYLAPEQARGEVVDERADVFALGCILCDILTGRPPFVGSSALDTLKMASVGDVAAAFQALDRTAVDPELIEIAKRCLAPSPAERFPDGLALHERIARYREGVESRLRESEKARAAEVVRMAESAKRRRVWSIFVVVTIIFSGVAAYLYREQEIATINQQRELERVDGERNRERDLERERTVALAAADVSAANLALSQGKLELAESTVARMEARFPQGLPQDLATSARRVRFDCETVRELNRIRDRSWTVVNFRYENDRSRRDYPAAFDKYGLAVASETPETLAARFNASAISERLRFALDEWLGIALPADRAPLLALLRELDKDARRTAIREALYGPDPSHAVELIDGLKVEEQPPTFIASLAFQEVIPLGIRRDMLVRSWERHSDDFLLTLSLAVNYGRYSPANWNRSAEFSRAVLAIEPRSAVAWNNLGNAFRELKQLDDALVAFKTAVELDPDVPSHHNGLGAVLRDRGQLEAAAEQYAKAMSLQPGDSGNHNGLGLVFALMNRPLEAEEQYVTALKIEPLWRSPLGNLLALIQGDDDWRRIESKLLALVEPLDAEAAGKFCDMIGSSLRHKMRLSDSIIWARKSCQLNPTDFLAWHGLAWAAMDAREHDEAISAARKAIETAPAHTRHTHHGVLGRALIGAGRYQEGVSEFRKASELKSSPAQAFHTLPSILEGDDVDFALQCYDRAKTEMLVPSAVFDRLLVKMADLGRIAQALETLNSALNERPDLWKDDLLQYRLAQLNVAQGFSETEVDSASSRNHRERAAVWFDSQINWARYHVSFQFTAKYRDIEQQLTKLLTDTGFERTRTAENLERYSPGERERWTSIWKAIGELRDEAARNMGGT